MRYLQIRSVMVNSFAVLHRKGATVTLTVQAKPNSKTNAILAVNEDYIKVAIKAAPVDG